MSDDSVTKITKQSWGSRLGGSIKGIGVGLIIFLIAFPLLFWNEGRSVKRHKALKEGAGVVISVNPDTVDPANNQKLVHVTGQITTDENLSDPLFQGVSANALKLRRNVKMYQWIESSRSETKNKVGGGTETTTTYSYAKGWSERLVDSARFQKQTGHINPSSMPYSSQEFQAERATLGAFYVPSNIVAGLSYSDRFRVPDNAKSNTHKSQVSNGALYIGYDPMNPAIGDISIEYDVVFPGTYSLVAKQTSNTFAPFMTKSGGEILLVKSGFHEADSMFKAAQSENRILTWILRLAGFLLMFFGLKMIFGPLGVLADVLPFLGSLMRVGTGLVSGILAFVLSLITIAIAWLFYRPILGGILLVVAIGSLIFLRKIWKRKKPAPAPAAG